MNWKSDSQSGGGIIRFYGIHLIAVLIALEYENYKIIKLKDNTQTIIFKIINVNKPEIEISINIDSNIENLRLKCSRIVQKKHALVAIKNPFEKQK